MLNISLLIGCVFGLFLLLKTSQERKKKLNGLF